MERAAADPGNLPAQLDAAALLFAGGRPDAAYEALIAEFSAAPTTSANRCRSSCWSCSSCRGRATRW